MKMCWVLFASAFICFAAKGAPAAFAEVSVYDFDARTIDGESQKLAQYRSNVALIVNVASQCGFTPQYVGLEKIYRQYKDRGFVVLGFPSNDFGEQEPGTDAEIKKFCTTTFGVSFPLFSKGPILGPKKQPLYGYLTAATGGHNVEWNFEKFLISRDGQILGRFPSSVKPEDPKLTSAIEAALAAPR